jgi:hypothetical protein
MSLQPESGETTFGRTSGSDREGADVARNWADARKRAIPLRGLCLPGDLQELDSHELLRFCVPGCESGPSPLSRGGLCSTGLAAVLSIKVAGCFIDIGRNQAEAHACARMRSRSTDRSGNPAMICRTQDCAR